MDNDNRTGGISTEKRCTNSACRKVFRIGIGWVRCPHCGKDYPRLRVRSYTLHRHNINHIQIEKAINCGEKIRQIKCLREITGLGLADTKIAVEALYDGIPFAIPLGDGKTQAGMSFREAVDRLLEMDFILK